MTVTRIPIDDLVRREQERARKWRGINEKAATPMSRREIQQLINNHHHERWTDLTEHITTLTATLARFRSGDTMTTVYGSNSALSFAAEPASIEQPSVEVRRALTDLIVEAQALRALWEE